MFCAACHQQMNSEARFCSHCGTPMPAQQQQAWSGYTSGYARRLMRPRVGRTMGGVCAGLAQYYGWDPILLRVLTVVLFFVGCGSILIAYLAAWVIIPNEPYYYYHVPPMSTPPAGSGPGAGYAGTVGGAPIS